MATNRQNGSANAVDFTKLDEALPETIAGVTFAPLNDLAALVGLYRMVRLAQVRNAFSHAEMVALYPVLIHAQKLRAMLEDRAKQSAAANQPRDTTDVPPKPAAVQSEFRDV